MLRQYSRRLLPHPWVRVDKSFDAKLAILILDSFPVKVTTDVTDGERLSDEYRLYVTKTKTPQIAELFANYNTDEAKSWFSTFLGVDCTQGHLRIELCTDSIGFYLNRHIDWPEKIMTFQTYLGSGDPIMGTSLYNDDNSLYATVPFVHNTGWITDNQSKVMHGVERGAVNSIRHSVIINYVTDGWRETNQLYNN